MRRRGLTASQVLALAAALIWSCTTSTITRAQQFDIRGLRGIPVLSAKPDSFAEAKLYIESEIAKGLPRLQRWRSDFDELKEHKAVAVEYRAPFENPFAPYLYRFKYFAPSIGHWGGAWEYDTLEGAKEAALKNCEGSCVIYREDGKIGVQDHLVQEYISAKKAYFAAKIDELERSTKIVGLERALQASSVPAEVPIKLAPVYPIQISYPDHQQDYASACFDHVFYALLPEQEANWKTQLKSVVERGSYGTYQRSVNTVLDFDKPRNDRIMTRMARFASHIHYQEDPVSAKMLKLPRNIADALSGEIIEEIWVEGAVRITSDGLPLVVEEVASPLAIKTNKGFYLGVQIRVPNVNGGCYVSKPFAGKVMDLSKCGDSTSCILGATQVLLETARRTLKEEPFLAHDIDNEPFGPGEFGLKRQFEESKILGPPYYELATYTVQTWAAGSEDPFYSLYRRQDYMGVNPNRREGGKLFVFLKISYVLTVSSHKNGTYSEPSMAEISKVDLVTSSKIKEVIQRTCAAVGGQMDGGVCDVPTAKGIVQ